MTRAEAQKVAEQLVHDAEIHYRAEHEKLNEALESARQQCLTWIESGSYRKKGYDRPHIVTKTVQNDYSRNISVTRRLQEGDK